MWFSFKENHMKKWLLALHVIIVTRGLTYSVFHGTDRKFAWLVSVAILSGESRHVNFRPVQMTLIVHRIALHSIQPQSAIQKRGWL